MSENRKFFCNVIKSTLVALKICETIKNAQTFLSSSLTHSFILSISLFRCTRKLLRARKNASRRMYEHSKFYQMESCIVSSKQYWNQNKYFILISIDFNTRMCFFLPFFFFSLFFPRLASIYQKLKAIAIFRSPGVLPSKKFFFFLFAFKTRAENFAL